MSQIAQARKRRKTRQETLLLVSKALERRVATMNAQKKVEKVKRGCSLQRLQKLTRRATEEPLRPKVERRAVCMAALTRIIKLKVDKTN